MFGLKLSDLIAPGSVGRKVATFALIAGGILLLRYLGKKMLTSRFDHETVEHAARAIEGGSEAEEKQA